MSEDTNTPVKPKRSLVKIILVTLSVVVLLLIYGAGVVLFPLRILTSYRDRNCDSVLSLNGIYTTLYPRFLEDNSINVQVAECEAYASAVTSEENEKWVDAYDAYQSYSNRYSNGLYTKEAYEHSASILIHIIRDQAEAKQYEGAIANLNKVISEYSDTESSADAWTLTPSVYTSWGTELRESGDFATSERVLNDFKSWSEHYQRNDVVLDAKRELAETYVAWGKSLQADAKFDDAIARFELAVKADPGVGKAAQQSAYVEWGNALLKDSEFSAAIKKFELAIALDTGGGENVAKDALSNGYIQWATQLRSDEDYFGALERLELAKGSAFKDETKQVVETAFSETYIAFSNSTGAQARQAIKEALKSICAGHKKPDLPIFGLNKETIRVGLYGADGSLPENLAVKTPGEMHYVACVDVLNHTVESRYHKVIIDRTSWGYYYRVVQQFRAEVLWDISLKKIDSMKDVAETTLTGGTPPPFDDAGGAGGFFFGPPPTIAQLSKWLESVVK